MKRVGTDRRANHEGFAEQQAITVETSMEKYRRLLSMSNIPIFRGYAKV
jgi:hypothetical protein